MKLYLKSFFCLISILSFAILSGCAGGSMSPEYGNYRSQVNAQMQEMSNVLFAGHAYEFMQTYVDPKYIASQGGIDKAMLQFGNAQQQLLFRVLRVAQNITPFYDENSKTLSYTLSISEPLRFTLINGKWYMDGNWFKH
jgi:hypothetical protein